MSKDKQVADDLISGSLKRAKSYHSEYGKKTYDDIKSAAKTDRKARQMKKLIEQAERLREKIRRRQT